MKGAPIRFIAAVVGGWTCVRIAVLLPEAAPLAIAADVLAPPAAATGRPEATSVPALPSTRTRRVPAATIVPGSPRPSRRRVTPIAPIAERSPLLPTPPAVQAGPSPPVLVAATLGSSTPAPLGRLGIGAWLLARGGANGTLSGGMLGASQAGVRLTYVFDGGRRVALSARVAAPLHGRGAEAAVGIDWQPLRAPVHLLAEQRLGLDGGRGGPSVTVIAGLNPTPVAAGFHLEAYAQAGAIRRDGRAEAFGDGAARLTHLIAAIGAATLDAGMGSWAAGQRGTGRIDAGPTIGVVLPVAGRRVRVSADWRQRLAGRARPGSGPALSIGTDF